MVLPEVVKASLILTQMNADLERSLSVNAHIVTKGQNLHGETIIVGLRAVRFHKPQGGQKMNL